MDRIQPYFKLNKKRMELEVWGTNPQRTFSDPCAAVYNPPKIYSLTEEDLPIVEKLMQRDFKTAILYRRSNNDGIAMMCDDIIIQKG